MDTHEGDLCYLVDCRWLSKGGAGRVNEWFLRGCQLDQPPGEWHLLGPDQVEPLVWRGAIHHRDTSSPRDLFGQRRLRLPPRDISLFFHQIRPLTGNPSVTTIYDTIPLRFGHRPRSKRRYLKLVAGLSAKVLTASEFAKGCLVRDLGIAPDTVHVLTLPRDDDLIARVRKKRETAPVEPMALYVGRFGPHKNLAALISAFQKSTFFTDGGRLELVGGSPDEVAALSATSEGVPRVSVSGACSQDALESLYARSAAVVMPSLEEGFGLPAWEAMMCGIPICISDGGSLPEATFGLVDPFPAASVGAMADALDRAVSEIDTEIPAERAREVTSRAPTLGEFAREICDLLRAEA